MMDWQGAGVVGTGVTRGEWEWGGGLSRTGVGFGANVISERLHSRARGVPVAGRGCGFYLRSWARFFSWSCEVAQFGDLNVGLGAGAPPHEAAASTILPNLALPIQQPLEFQWRCGDGRLQEEQREQLARTSRGVGTSVTVTGGLPRNHEAEGADRLRAF
jgi:hypothetical protein